MATPRIKVSPYFNEFLYDILSRAGITQKRALPKRYASKVKTEAAARKFVDKSYFEEKIEVLQGLGFNWFIIVIEETGLSMKYAKQVFDSYRPEGQILTAKDIVEKHLYVTSDRKFAYEHGLMADMANSPQYSQALLLNKAGYHIEKWRKSMKGPLTDTAKYHIDITKYLIEMSLNISLQLDYIHDFLGITRNDFKILSYLYIKQHTFVDYAQIFQRFSDNLNLHKVTGCIRRLSQAGMIVKTPKTMERKYQITALGIKGIADFYKQILKANEF